MIVGIGVTCDQRVSSRRDHTIDHPAALPFQKPKRFAKGEIAKDIARQVGKPFCGVDRPRHRRESNTQSADMREKVLFHGSKCFI